MATPLRFPCVVVCQHRTCRKQGAQAVLAAFRQHQPDGWSVYGSGCMGQCGNGPMVRILPEDVWYWRVQPDVVPRIVTQHLQGGTAIAQLLYPMRPKPPSP